MSWNKYFIIIEDVKNLSTKEAVDAIGFDNLKFVRETDFQTASKLRELTMVACGRVDNSLWMISRSDVVEFFKEGPSPLETRLSEVFNDTRIVALEENATINGFGFNLIENGARTRVICGYENEYEHAYGDPLEIESAQLQVAEAEMEGEEKSELLKKGGEQGLKEAIQFKALWRTPMAFLHEDMGFDIEKVCDDNPPFLIFRHGNQWNS